MTAQLELRGITKQYPGVLANDHIDLVIGHGEVHALLGENGAGKSTLVKIIYGVVRADSGEIYWNGEPVHIANPSQARRLGIGMVFQHFNLFETLTVAENISLGIDENHDLKQLTGEIQEISEKYGLPINPHQHVHALSVGERQRVEIIRCLVQDPKVLIMDEPTSVLTPQEVDKLFETLRRLSSEGCSILYISHKLDEIQALCDKATVLRHGKVSADCNPREETPKSLAEMMIGSELPVCKRTAQERHSDIRLQVRGLTIPSPDPHGTDLTNINATVHRGEVLGIAGVAGNGQREFLSAINGELLSPLQGSIQLNGTEISNLGPAERRTMGLAFVPEERLGRGAVPEMSLADNALLTAYQEDMLHNGFIRFGKVRAYASHVRERFDVRSPGYRRRSEKPLRRQSAEVHHRPGNHHETAASDPRSPDLGGRCGRCNHHPSGDCRSGGGGHLRGGRVPRISMSCLKSAIRFTVIAEGRLSPIKRISRPTDVEEVGLWMSGQFDGRRQRRQVGSCCLGSNHASSRPGLDAVCLAADRCRSH